MLSDWETHSDSRDPDHLETSLETLQHNRFDDFQHQLEAIDPTEETKRTEYEESYNKAVGKIRRFLREAANIPMHLSVQITRMKPSLPVTLPQISRTSTDFLRNGDSNESEL
ncbi:hypothetical protein HHI36_002686 [Cryptolaemus montrouzieri]|uniref:Uncharacterized protein n=1 Tax=Cryptolaemus montrouzieri TaxID=559131 RepID=A0ABD2PC20_9CUCU